jgi:hypothetical protein
MVTHIVLRTNNTDEPAYWHKETEARTDKQVVELDGFTRYH